MAYGARLESVLSESSQGFESPILRPVLSRDTSSPFKGVAHRSSSTWMHRVGLRLVEDVDSELIGKVNRAYEEAR